MSKFKLNKYDWVTLPMVIGTLIITGIPFIVTFIYLGMLLAHTIFG
jgi:hypothetical protein